MLVDIPLQHEVEGRVDRLVEEVEELESKQAELMDELVIKVAEVITSCKARIMNAETTTPLMTCIQEDDRNVNLKIMHAVQDISGCGDNQKVKYFVGSLTGRALTWWNSEVRTRGRETIVGMTWENFKALIKGEYCPSNKIQRLETRFWSHFMVGTDLFYDLARLVPHLVTPDNKRIERYIYGLAPQICRMVAATEPPMVVSRVRKEMSRVIIRELELKKCLPQSPTLLGKSTRVRHPNVQTVISTITPIRLFVRARTATA
ncbi:reverse transcriptase domain-containing protein [Tanacetum coccineum]